MPRPDRPWVEGLDLVLDRYARLAEENPHGSLPPAVAIVIDNIGQAYVVVPLNDLLDLYLHRIRSNLNPKSRKFTFVLIRGQDGYSLQMPHDKSEVPLTTVNSLERLSLSVSGPPKTCAHRSDEIFTMYGDSSPSPSSRFGAK